MSKILQLLEMTPQQYEEMFFGAYMRWCISFTVKITDLQALMANTPLNAYYRMEYTKCEVEFLRRIEPYENLTTIETRKVYHNCTYEMFNRRSKPLIAQALKTNIINEPTAN